MVIAIRSNPEPEPMLMTNSGADPRARLVELAAARGVSLAALSALIHRNSAYLQQFVKKGSPRKLEEEDRRTLARYFGVGEAELGGRDDAAAALPGADARDWADIPRIAAMASAGPGALAGDEAAFGALRFSTRWLRGQGLDPGRLTAIAVSGDSMEPTLRDGDEILVDTTPGRAGSRVLGGIHVVRLGNAVLVKRLEARLPGQFTLVSDNDAYDPLDVLCEEVAVIGRVVWKSGRI